MNQNANARDYQKILEQQILGLNYRSFTQVVILGSSTFVPFMQLNTKNRREVVEDILDIKIFSLMNLVLKTKYREVSTNAQDTKYSQDLTKNKIQMQEKYITDARNNRENLLTEKKIKFVKLPVSAPFHSPLMRNATLEMQNKINDAIFSNPKALLF